MKPEVAYFTNILKAEAEKEQTASGLKSNTEYFEKEWGGLIKILK